MYYTKLVRALLLLSAATLTACNSSPSVEPLGNVQVPSSSSGGLSTSASNSTTSAGAVTVPESGGGEVVPLPTRDKPLALIYKGQGSCSLDQGDAGTSGYGCSEASADSAVLAGFRYQFVGPNDLSSRSTAAEVKALFGNAKVWIQPGGISNTAYYAMSSKLKTELISFVSNGGGYVGFCAGAFLATDWFYLMPASASLYDYSPSRYDITYAFLPVTWNGKKRSVYFEGGPYLYGLGTGVEATAKFSDGLVAAARSTYGKGRVYISGPHPEAPAVWSEEDGMKDVDGNDHDLAAQMITWAAGI